MDIENWEIHFLKGALANGKPRFQRVAYIPHSDMQEIASKRTYKDSPIDERIVEIAEFLHQAPLPFEATDHFEYWLLDEADESPLALIFSCHTAEQTKDFPEHPEWTALSSAAMKISSTREEQELSLPPVNHRFERLIAEVAGRYPKARWFDRSESSPDIFPELMVREEWSEPEHQDLCDRYINRQATRLLTLQGLSRETRRRLEQAASRHPFEVERFYPIYPEVADEEQMNTIRVEARMRGVEETESSENQTNQRQGILYI